MTFEQFQATRKHVDDLEATLDFVITGDPEVPCPGLVYLDALYIEEANDNWTEVQRTEGRYLLVIGRSDWHSSDLEALERRLYDFAVSEGYTLPEAPAA